MLDIHPMIVACLAYAELLCFINLHCVLMLMIVASLACVELLGFINHSVFMHMYSISM